MVILIVAPLQITLRRAIYSLTITKQLGLAVKLLFNNEKITKSDVESFKGDLLEVQITILHHVFKHIKSPPVSLHSLPVCSTFRVVLYSLTPFLKLIMLTRHPLETDYANTSHFRN